MSPHSDHDSSYDKSLRSLLDALSMLEREASFLFDRFGVDPATARRGLGVLSTLSAELVRPLAASLGLADTAALEALAKDLRSLLDAASGREARSEARLDGLEAALRALDATTRQLARLQGRTLQRLDSLSAQASSLEARAESRMRLAEDLARLREKVERLESEIHARTGVDPTPPVGLRARPSRRVALRVAEAPRTVRSPVEEETPAAIDGEVEPG